MNPFPVPAPSTRNKTRTTGVGTNTCITTSRISKTVGTTASDGVVSFNIPMDPFNPQVAPAVVNSIAGCYEFYRIVSAAVDIVPTGGYTTAGSIQHAFLCNPETMVGASSGADVVRYNLLLNEQGSDHQPLNVKTTKTMQAGRLTSRRWYSCNYSGSVTVPEWDRTMAATHCYRLVGPVSTAINALITYRITYEFKSLGFTSNFTLSQSVNNLPVFPYNTLDDGYPGAIILSKRDASTQEYVRKPEPKPVPPLPQPLHGDVMVGPE